MPIPDDTMAASSRTLYTRIGLTPAQSHGAASSDSNSIASE